MFRRLNKRELGKLQRDNLKRYKLIRYVEKVNMRRSVASSDTGTAHYGTNELAATTQTVLHGSGIQHSGQGNFNVQGNVNITSNLPPRSGYSEEEIAECMKALFLTDPCEDRNMLIRKKGNRASGTCEWILDTEELTGWLRSEEAKPGSRPNNVLWLHGNPGTGKSTMAICLTEVLWRLLCKDDTVAYFFCDASFEKRRTATSIIRGLLFQLAQSQRALLENYVLPNFKERGHELFTSFDALWTVFIAAAEDRATGRTYCIIDALDECDHDSQENLLYQLQQTFQNRENGSPKNISILITSRPYPETREWLQSFINRDLASFDQTRQDIDRCINERVNDLAMRKHYTEKVKREISSLLRDKAEGTFLWVGLACEELRGKPSKDAIQFLRDMPRGLESLYGNLYDMAVGDNEDGEKDLILMFAAVSFSALSVLEFSDACGLYQDEPDLETRLQYTRDQIASCRLLVGIQDERVQLLHQSVRDFLVGNGRLDRHEAHAHAASLCIRVLSAVHDETRSPSPFFMYATRHWPEHAREAQESFRIHELHMEFFEVNSLSMERWLNNFVEPSGLSLLHVAARWGLPILMEYALGLREVYRDTRGSRSIFLGKLDVNCLDSKGRTALWWARQWGHTGIGLQMVAKLLEAGANSEGPGSGKGNLKLSLRSESSAIAS